MTREEAIEILKKRIKSPFVRANKETLEALAIGLTALEGAEGNTKFVTDSWSVVGVEYRLFPGGVECEITYEDMAGFNVVKSFETAASGEVEKYDRQELATKALNNAIDKMKVESEHCQKEYDRRFKSGRAGYSKQLELLKEEYPEYVKFIPHLSERERLIIRQRSCGKTLKSVGETLNLIPERIRQIETKACWKLRKLVGQFRWGRIEQKGV